MEWVSRLSGFVSAQCYISEQPSVHNALRRATITPFTPFTHPMRSVAACDSPRVPQLLSLQLGALWECCPLIVSWRSLSEPLTPLVVDVIAIAGGKGRVGTELRTLIRRRF